MALVAGQRSTLNPNAPLFIPAVYRQVEDFSPQWWELVTTSTWFRDYWLSEHPEGSFDGSAGGGDGGFDDCVEDFLPERLDVGFDEEYGNLEAQFEELIMLTEYAEKTQQLGNELIMLIKDEVKRQQLVNGSVQMDVKGILKDLSVPKYGKERSIKSPGKASKHQMKAGHNLSPKSAAPRRIHQIHQPR
ncbi:hypothetical protein JCGZ_24492 [Jatropha curcas]|uniref:Uncharacterized protein n=1 Tax=Jatropha curcas TaxID=180498 RepID=A0A067KZS4_JATCU|nr:hypothetical protein JCGZ_24492 [Jatropha curcas]